MTFDLPEGISHTRTIEELLHEIVPYDYQLDWQCPHCQLSFEAFLLTPNGRYEGLIRNKLSGAELWNNKLPRQKDRAIELLRENFERKVENHRKVH